MGDKAGAGLTKCPQCGKMFAARPGKTLCAKCIEEEEERISRIEEAVSTYNKTSIEEIATFAGVSVHEVERLVEKSSLLSRAIEQQRPCERCKEKTAMPRSKYCLSCRIDLNYDLHHAAKTVAEKADEQARRKREMEGKASHLGEAMEEKRGRTSKNRLDPTPHNRYG